MVVQDFFSVGISFIAGDERWGSPPPPPGAVAVRERSRPARFLEPVQHLTTDTQVRFP